MGTLALLKLITMASTRYYSNIRITKRVKYSCDSCGFFQFWKEKSGLRGLRLYREFIVNLRTKDVLTKPLFG